MQKLRTSSAVIAALLFIPLTQVFAQDVASFKDLETIFGNVIKALVELAGVVLFVMLVVGGFKFLLSGGDQKKLEAARGTVTNAIIGLVVIVVAYLILLTIQTFTGVNVTQFTIPTGP